MVHRRGTGPPPVPLSSLRGPAPDWLFVLDLSEYRGIECLCAGLTARGSPEILLRHHLDQVLAVHRLAGFGQHLGGGVDRAELLLAALGRLLATSSLRRLGRGFGAGPSATGTSGAVCVAASSDERGP